MTLIEKVICEMGSKSKSLKALTEFKSCYYQLHVEETKQFLSGVPLIRYNSKTGIQKVLLHHVAAGFN